MTVHWNILAEQQLDHSIAFVEEQWGKTIAQRLLRQTHRISRMLAKHPHLGHIEPLLSDRPIAYRSIVVERYHKIVYYIKDTCVYVAAVWDTRRDPSALTSAYVED